MLLNFNSLELNGEYDISSEAGNNYLFIFIQEGSIELVFDKDTIQTFSSGMLFLKMKNVKRYKMKGINSSFSTLEVDELLLADYLIEINASSSEYNFVALDHDVCFNNVKSLFEMIKYEMALNHLNTSVVHQLFQSVLSIYNSEFVKLKSDVQYSPLQNNLHIKKLIALVEENYRKNLPLEFYANQLYLSQRQVNNLSQKYFKTSLNILITKRKITEAKLLLKESSLQINEIGYELGFKEKSYFTRVFKLHTQVSPKAFRDHFTNFSKLYN